MIRRFFIYLIGVGLGVIVSLFFFGDREIDFSYLPNARTLKHLRGQAFEISEKALCQLNCISMTERSFEKLFYDSDLDVDFGVSDVGGQCRTYFIQVQEQKFSKFNIQDCDSTSTILSIDVLSCECL